MKPAFLQNVVRLMLAVFACPAVVSSQEPADAPPASEATAVFEAPKKYGIERYMAGWERNPFSTPTPPSAPAPVESVFKDLAYTSVYGPQDNPTFTVVDTRTHERYKLSLNTPDKKKGMVLKSFSLGNSRKEATLEVALGTETATLKYAADYAKQAPQAAGGRPGAVPGAPGVPGAPQVIPRPGMPVAGKPGAMNTAVISQTRNMPQPASSPTIVGAPAQPASVPGTQITLGITGGSGTITVTNPGATTPPPATTAPPATIPLPTTPAVGAPVNPAPGAPQRRRLIN